MLMSTSVDSRDLILSMVLCTNTQRRGTETLGSTAVRTAGLLESEKCDLISIQPEQTTPAPNKSKGKFSNKNFTNPNQNT